MTREELLKSLMELDFMAVDIGLFLNTHPNDSVMIQEYNKIITAAQILREKFENMYGPLCSFRSYAQKGWEWIDNPWPWQKEANFDL